MLRRKYIKLKVRESTKFVNILSNDGSAQSQILVGEEVPEGFHVTGWVTKEKCVTYRMPTEDFLAKAERLE